MYRRLPAVLAAVAALLWAPSLASAAGNSLVSPSVSPSSGTITTVFTVRVDYDGKFPASTVSVSVGALELPMARVGGTATEGTWSVRTLLPAGTWTPAFSSTSQRGNAAVIAGPSVTVTGAVAPTPAPTVSGPSPDNREVDAGDPVLPAQPAGSQEPAVAPAERNSETAPPAESDPAASTTADPSTGGGHGGGGTSVPVGPSAPAGSTFDDDGGTDPAVASPPDAPRAEASGEPRAAPTSSSIAGGQPPGIHVEDGLLKAVLLIGLSGVAAVALIGTALLIVGRRRAANEGSPPAAGELADTETLLERRTLRRAKVRLMDDPITTALGVDDQVAARRQRRLARETAAGPAERPKPPGHELG
jgi:hypothetical protein